LPSDIVLNQLYPTSRLVSMITGMSVQQNKAVVGGNAFSHESGIHQDGLLKSPQTYQLLNPEDIGLKGYQLILGKLSGKKALKEK